ncbi:MAG TPA: Ig-like domain-containing protein [Usitatibacter sp.]|nr:Ig-like domain-containing protein [Usitatibacter sp.]
MAALLGFAAVPAGAAFDIPTGASPSPLFGAQPFTQKMLMFEEFGVQPLPATFTAGAALPDPLGCAGAADLVTWTTQVDQFLSQAIYPAPQEQANTSGPNPWAARISTCLGRSVAGVMEGRPPGVDFAHQRWAEFTPSVYFQTGLAPSRPNGGIRDRLQRHGYALGEFGPGGLYNDTTGAGTLGTTKGIRIKFHPAMPEQDQIHLWTFDGTLPPKLLMAPYGTTIAFRNYNFLPIDEAANGGFGAHTITTHEHNGHNPAESDGFAGAYFFPGEYYDYHWPMILAGHDSFPIGSTDPVLAEKNLKSGTPDGHGGYTKVRGNWHETMSTHWFHDHMLDATAQNVYKGNAAMMNYYSAIDRGREPASATEAQGSSTNPGYGCNYADPTDVNPNNVNLCLPSGSAQDWGNRDYDINLVVADKAFDPTGQLFFNIFQTDGFLGDVATVNFLYKPYFDVRARKYRFRILNGSVSRYWKIAFVDQAGNQVPFHLVANDGNLLEHAVAFPNAESPEGLPEQGIAERYDIVIDFSKFKDGDKVYAVNLLEHQDGKTPNQAIALSTVLSGAYSAGGCPATCDPVVGKFMEIRVHSYSGTDLSMNPADYVVGKKKMIPLPGFTAQELANAKERTFEFDRGGDVKPWTIKTNGGQAYNASTTPGMGDLKIFDRVSAAPTRGTVEIWHLRNGGQGWAHPVHIHFEEGQILERGGKAPFSWEKGARKDMYRIGPLPTSTDSVDLAIRVREFLGTYVEHCHNTQHEDNAMLLRWDSENPGQTVAIHTPFPTWDGVTYVDSNTTDVPTWQTGLATSFLAGGVSAPIANDDYVFGAANSAVKVNVIDNDKCVGGCNPATVAIRIQPKQGKAAVNADGTITYTPNRNFTGSDFLKYTVRDTTNGAVDSNYAALTVGVLSAPPALKDGAVVIQEVVTGIDVTANDGNCPPGACSVTVTTPPMAGAIVVPNKPNVGQVTYLSAPGYVGPDSFSYTATNAAGTSKPATVSVSVQSAATRDVVTIVKDSYTGGQLSMNGTVSMMNGAFAKSVTVYVASINASWTACMGTAAGTAAVDSKGNWSFSKSGLAGPIDVCVQSSNFGVDYVELSGV